jgi:hypothetical protein
MAQLLLYGVPAFVSQVTGPTTCQFYVDEADFTPANLIAIDLAQNTSLPPAQWATAVDVDIATTGGYTTIGPRFHNAPHIGAAYISERVWNRFPAGRASWPPAPDAIYQYQAVLRTSSDSAPASVVRYHGFKVKIVGPTVGTIVMVAFIPAGAAAPVVTSPVRWIDLADPAVCDPAANGFTTIVPASPMGMIGALFLTSAAIAAQAMDIPKTPHNQGE